MNRSDEVAMRILFSILTMLMAGAAQAHESIVPHEHPHGPSMLPGVNLIGVAALILALALIVVMKMRER
jgi:hypothetical protein